MSCNIFGREEVEFSLNIINDTNNTSSNTTANAIVDFSSDWNISDFFLNFSDNSTVLTNISYTETPTKIFESEGIKEVNVYTDFNDGWDNIYEHHTYLEVEALPYIKPQLDFSWSPEEPTILDIVTFSQMHNDSRNQLTNEYFGRIDEVRIDYYDDGINEVDFILKEEFTEYQFLEKMDNIPIKLEATYWDGWEYQTHELVQYLNMANIPPVSTWNREDNGVCIPSYNWTATSTDLDDDDNLLTFEWKLFQKMGESWNLIDTSTNKLYSYPFQFEGLYKTELITYDIEGQSDVKIEEFNVLFSECGTNTGTCEGKVILQPNRWQMIALPVQNKNVSDLMQVISVKTGLQANEVIEVANAYPSTDLIGGTFLSFVPDFTNELSSNNFKLIKDDENAKEITAFWIKVLDYPSNIEINWTSDSLS